METEMQAVRNSNDSSPKSMVLFDSPSYSLNKRMLCFYGQWPYQSPLERRIRTFIILSFSFGMLGPQARAMVFSWGRLDSFSESFSTVLTNVTCQIKLVNFMLMQKQLRSLLDDTRRNWEGTQDAMQANILKQYGERGRVWSMMWLSLIYFVIVVWLILAMMPKILDALVPLNSSRPTFDVIPTNYGVDQDEYYWWIQLHCWSSTIVFLGVTPAIDSLYIVLAQHVCGMFEILSRLILAHLESFNNKLYITTRIDPFTCLINMAYSLETATQDDQGMNVALKPDIHDGVYYHKVVSCIKKHKYLVSYIRKIAFTNEASLLIVVVLNMVDLSVTGYQAVAKGTEKDVAVRFALYTFGILFHLFVITLPSHWIMESSNSFPTSVYSSKWYLMSLKTRKLIVLTTSASVRPCVIKAGKVYVMSIENFYSLLKTSMSYLTMLTSMQ